MKLLIVPFLFTLLIAIGCGEPQTRTDTTQTQTDTTQTDTTQTPDQKVSLAATVAKEIQANPEQSDGILKKHNLTQEQFESLLYEIAADAELTRKYQTALSEE